MPLDSKHTEASFSLNSIDLGVRIAEYHTDYEKNCDAFQFIWVDNVSKD